MTSKANIELANNKNKFQKAMFLVIARTFREGMRGIFRNGWLSFATVSVMTMSLFVVSSLLLVTLTANNVLKNVQEKINISVYFKSDVAEEDILKDQKDLQNFSEIQSVDYVSRDQALEDFKKNNANEPAIMKSLDVLGSNPLLASLVIKAKSPEQYEAISSYISSASFKSDVSRVNYGKSKDIIDKLNVFVAEIKKVGLALSILFALISVLITFNTIRITIYTHRQEVEVMRLVGASNVYIRLPFIFEGVIYGIVASIVSSLLLLLSVEFVDKYMPNLVSGQNFVAFYLENLAMLLGIQILIGVVLGVFSSMIAIRKYLKV